MLLKFYKLISVILLIIFPFYLIPLFTSSQAATESNCVETAIGAPPQNAQGGCSTGVQCSTTPPTDIVGALRQDGFILNGSELNDFGEKAAFNTICLLKKSSKYMQLLGASPSNPIEIRFKSLAENQGSHNYNCTGQASAYAPRNIELYGATTDPECQDYRLQFLIAHELGHLLRYNNDALFNTWQAQYYNPSFPTWNCQLDYGPGPWPEECFPDMLAEYVFYKKWKMFSAPPVPFPEMKTTYATMYDFAKNNIFGGVEY